jgi:hypothetical protein
MVVLRMRDCVPAKSSPLQYREDWVGASLVKRAASVIQVMRRAFLWSSGGLLGAESHWLATLGSVRCVVLSYLRAFAVLQGAAGHAQVSPGWLLPRLAT